MLAIRLQRTGRKGHAQFRMVVQESRLSPSSGRVVARLGSYNPHSKELVIDKEQASNYLSNGAQPSERVAFLLKKEGVKLPDWVVLPSKQERSIRNPEKLRKNRPAEEVAPKDDAPNEAHIEEAGESTTDEVVAAEEQQAEEPSQEPERVEEIATTDENSGPTQDSPEDQETKA